VSPERPQTIYAGTNEGPFLTTNGGRTWRPLNGGLPSFTRQLALDPQNPDKLYAGTPKGVPRISRTTRWRSARFSLSSRHRALPS
jgi:hypothetical protein